MDSDRKVVDIISEIACLTGIKIDAIKLVLDAYDLVVLDKVLESQLTNDDTDFMEVGSLLLDNTNYPTVVLRAGDQLATKINQTVHSGRDFLSESIIARFTNDLVARYSNEPIEEHTPAILVGEQNE